MPNGSGWLPGQDAHTPRFTRSQLRQLKRIEEAGRAIADRYDVHLDYTTHPIDPANARGFNRAMERMAKEYPSTFRRLVNIKVQSLKEMRLFDPANDERTAGYTIKPEDRAKLPTGHYFNQHVYGNKAITDALASRATETGFTIPNGVSAEGTFYHEFGHMLGVEILTDYRKVAEMADALRNVGVAVDSGSLGPSLLTGTVPIIKGLSEYASWTPSEMLAEAFAEWKLSPKPRPIAVAVGTVIDKYFKEG